MKRQSFYIFLSLVLLIGFGAKAQLPAYKIYNSAGEEVTFQAMATELGKIDVVLFGEYHNNPIHHWLQLEYVKFADSTLKKVKVGAEMFERDNQLVLDEYLNGFTTIEKVKSETKAWPNFKTDYQPVLEYCAENKVSFVATNVPRRYASIVAGKGIAALDSLSKEAKALLHGAKYKVLESDTGYQLMKTQMGGHGMGMSIDNMIAAQALKDFVMAKSIIESREKGEHFIHLNGSFHSQYKAGICSYLNEYAPKLSYAVIAVADSESSDLVFDQEWSKLGDYIIVTPSSMTATH